MEHLGLGTTVIPRVFQREAIAARLKELLDSLQVREQCHLTSERVKTSGGLVNTYKTIESRLLESPAQTQRRALGKS